MNNKALPTLAVIVAVGIFFGYVSPTWNGEIAATKAAIKSDDAALAAADAYTKQQSKLTSSRNAIDLKDLSRLETFLPSSVDNVRLILDLDALAARSGLSLANIDVANANSSTAKTGTNTPASAPANTTMNANIPTANGLSATAANPVGSVDLTLSAVGTYRALHSFLDGVEKSGRLLDVRDLNIKGSSTGAYSYQMTIRLYWLR